MAIGMYGSIASLKAEFQCLALGMLEFKLKTNSIMWSYKQTLKYSWEGYMVQEPELYWIDYYEGKAGKSGPVQGRCIAVTLKNCTHPRPPISADLKHRNDSSNLLINFLEKQFHFS